MKKFVRIFVLSCVVLFLGIINTNAEGLVCGTTMRYGSTGENVKALQTLLNEKVGCNLVVDGSYGSETKTPQFEQEPSGPDISVAGTNTHYLFARGNGNVYIYTSKGVQAIMSMKYFVTPKTK